MRFRRNFFRHTDFLRLKILKKIFKKNSDFRRHRKMYRLVLCIPIFSGVFFIKSAKRMCICDYVKIALVLVKNVFFGLKRV